MPKVNKINSEKSKKQIIDVPMDKSDVYKAVQKTDAPTQAIETNGGQVANENSLLWVLASIQHAKKNYA